MKSKSLFAYASLLMSFLILLFFSLPDFIGGKAVSEAADRNSELFDYSNPAPIGAAMLPPGDDGLYEPAAARFYTPDIYEPDDYYTLANVIIIDDEMPQTHNIHVVADQDWVVIYGRWGETYYFNAEPGPNCDPAFGLYYSDGTPIERWENIDDYMIGEVEDFSYRFSDTAKASGDDFIYIKVHNSAGTAGPGTNYSLSVIIPDMPFPGFVKGTITDIDTGDPLSYVAITVSDNGSAISVPTGFYRLIASASASQYTLIAKKDGYTTYQGLVTVNEAQTTDHDIQLEPIAQKQTYWLDDDGDGYGDPDKSIQAVEPPAGYVSNNNDCDDSNKDIHPGATEVCNDKDDNCDGSVDEGQTQTFYRDNDGDTFGDPNISVITCTLPIGYVSNNNDCDDNNSNIHPGAAEVCNDKDDNCNGSVDEGLTKNTYYRDVDGDTFGNPDDSILTCTLPSGYVSNYGDCDDADPAVNPAATEICNGKDDDCDKAVDEGCLVGTYYLAEGWNLISLYVQPSDTNIEKVLTAIAGKHQSVWSYVGGSWLFYDPANPSFSDLKNMEAGQGYWIKMKEAASIIPSGETPPTSISLANGWNLVGYCSQTSRSTSAALASISGKYTSIWAYIGQNWRFYDPLNSAFSDLTNMEAKYGYWIKAKEACTWTLP